MPGIRIMNSSAADARDGENRKRTHDGKLVNGERTPRTPAANGATPATPSGMNGAVAAIAGPVLPVNRMEELPPEIAGVGPESYRSLSTLITRTAQETFNDMTGVLQQMADIPLNQRPNGALPNGLSHHVEVQAENAEVNKKKKLLLMQFGQTNRAKFIKLLVISNWAKKFAGPIAKLIDVYAWLGKEAANVDYIDTQLDIIRQWTIDLGERNPDMKTALEILSTGKADWIPDVGFLVSSCFDPHTD